MPLPTRAWRSFVSRARSPVLSWGRRQVSPMSQQVSQPVSPAQPNLPYYGVLDLALFRSYTRESYRAAFGVEAPPYNPARVIKTWFDSTADISQPDNVSVYNVAGRSSDGLYHMRQLVVPSAEAAVVNLAGAIAYPVYVVAPTTTQRVLPGNPPTTVNPNYLSQEADASALSKEIGGDGIAQEQDGGGLTFDYGLEPRRLWEILWHGKRINAGLLLLNRNARGVGSPGHWDLTKQEPVWVADAPAPTGLDDTRPPRPMPLRPLLANERFHQGLMDVGIER